MLIVALLTFVHGIVGWMLGWVPLADVNTLQSAASVSTLFLKYLSTLNVYFPFNEAVSATADYLAIYMAVMTFGLIRRTFSLLWPGAGS